jgi:hypothetical protein
MEPQPQHRAPRRRRRRRRTWPELMQVMASAMRGALDTTRLTEAEPVTAKAP